MNLRAKAIALVLATMTVITPWSAAFADDDNDKRPIPSSTEFPKPHHLHPEEDELHDRYGEDVGQINMPPLVVKEPKTGAAATGGSEPLNASTSEKLVDASNVNPAANLPVDPTSINPQSGTPADTFFNAATVGLGVMGVGVLALASVAIRRAVKLRKDPKADFLYQ